MNIFQSIDYAAIAKIVGIDLMLGVDNAIVIALACAALPSDLRRRAILLGTLGAIVLRAILLAGAGYLMGVPYLKLVAGLYLVYLGYKLLSADEGDEDHNIVAADRVFAAVKTVIVADFMMSLDNVLAVAGAAQSAGAHSTLYAIAGIVLSIPVIVFGATGLSTLMNRFPVIVWLGGGLLGWVGAEMVLGDHGLAIPVGALTASIGEHTHVLVKLAGFAGVLSAALLMKYAAKPATVTSKVEI